MMIRCLRLMLLVLSAQVAVAQPIHNPLTNAIDVLSLPAERAAEGIEVSIKGIVTAAQPDWQGKFFVQDESAGIFVVLTNTAQPSPGDLVRLLS